MRSHADPSVGQVETTVSPVPLQRQVDNILTLPLPACLRLTYSGFSSPPGTGSGGSGRNENTQPTSTARTRPRPVYEVLLEKGRLAEEKRERLAQEAIERELQALSAAPNLGRPAAAKRRSATAEAAPAEKIEDRLLKRAKEREAQRQHQAKAQEDKMEKQLAAVATFHPRISKRAQSTKSKVYGPQPDREAWRQGRLAELELAREKTDREARGTDAFQPAIDRQSALLAHRANTREGLDTTDVADRILAREAQRKSRQWVQFAEAQLHDRQTDGRPNITPRAAALVRPGSPGQRLYASAFAMAERQWEREAAEACAAPRSGFAPRITKSGLAATPRYLNPSVSEGPSAEAARHSFHPSIDPVSAILASEMEESPWERLYASHAQTASLASDCSTAYAASGLYRPPIRPLSPRAAAALEADGQRRQLWYAQQRADKEEREQQECTFAPRTNARPLRSQGRPAPTSWAEAAPPSPTKRPASGVDHVAARSRTWEDRRQQRLQELRDMAFSNERDAPSRRDSRNNE